MYRYKNFLLKHVRVARRGPESLMTKDMWLSRAAVRLMSGTSDADSEVVMNRVLGLVKKYDKIDASKVTEKADFQKDLGLDSLDRVELVMAFEQEFSVEIPDERADQLVCCSDVVDFILSEARGGPGKNPAA
ncbi:unnamed protein product [Spirodela intermedia]|uniref:Acyl carrier protein n=1 Tax=Spirodela intermedia TaxID=51605 RepID=A0A7I8K6U5_SPIIN|nr:unnamed protein product [Spirodela intermedia]